MTGVQLVAFTAINMNNGEFVSTMLPYRSFVTVGVETQKLASGDLAEVGKTYMVTAQVQGEMIPYIKQWELAGDDVWIAGFSRDGNILQARGQVKADGNRLLIDRPCAGGYTKDGMHTAGMSFCKNAFAISKWKGHDGMVLFPFNQDLTISHSGRKSFTLQELDKNMDIIGSHVVYDKVHFMPHVDTVFLYIQDDDRKSVKSPMLNMGKNAVNYEDFNV